MNVINIVFRKILFRPTASKSTLSKKNFDFHINSIFQTLAIKVIIYYRLSDPLSRGSKISLKASPNILNARTTTVITNPGTNDNQG